MHATQPLYWQVADRIVEGIRLGTWAPGDKLPSEHALCELYHVSQITVRRALRELAHQSRVYSRHGLGWYVQEEWQSTGVSGGRCDAAVITFAPDALTDRLTGSCVAALLPLSKVLQVCYYPTFTIASSHSAVGAAVPEGVPLLWAVMGPEEALKERYRALTADHASGSLLYGRALEGLDLPSIGIDEQAAMAQVTAHVIAQGHRRIAYVGSDPLQVEGWRRYSGFAACIWDHGLELSLDWVFSVGDEGAIDSRFDRAMAGNMHPTAVVCSTDTLAARIIHRLASRGLACPSDVAVTGMGDESFGAYLAEPLTTFRFDFASAAQQVVSALDAIGQGRVPVTSPITGDLIVRTSCGARTGRASGGKP